MDAQAVRILRLLRIFFGGFVLFWVFKLFLCENTLNLITLPWFCIIPKTSLNIDSGECGQLLILMPYFWTLKGKANMVWVQNNWMCSTFFFKVSLSQKLRVDTIHPRQYFCVYIILVLLSRLHQLFFWISVVLLKYVGKILGIFYQTTLQLL